MKGLLFLLFARSALAAVTIACGSPNDAYFTGGAAWPATGTAADRAIMGALPAAYSTLRYSAPPGVAFSYVVAMPPNTTGRYQVKLGFVEPNKTGPGQRVFSVSANGIPVIAALDLFAVAGLLKPYDQSFTVVAPDGRITVTFTPAGPKYNAVVSNIQVDDASAPLPPANAPPCEVGIGATYQTPYGADGVNSSGNMFTGVNWKMRCQNMTGRALLVTRVRCLSDVDGQAFDLMARDTNGVLQTLLTAPIVCTAAGTDGVVLPGASYTDGQPLYFLFRVILTFPATATQILATVSLR
jgi:hypothetical protein